MLSDVFSFSSQDLELESRVLFQLRCFCMSQAPESHSPPPFFPSLPCPFPWGKGRAGTCLKALRKKLIGPSGGFHRETAAEYEKEELKKQRKEEERKKSREITRAQEEDV